MRVLVLLMLACALAACARVPDADAIRGTIEAMAAAAQARRGDEVLDRIARDFTGNDGEFDREGFERMLRMRMLAGRNIGISLGAIEVRVDGERATARFAMTVADDSGRWIPGRRARLDVTTGWRRDGRDWLCYNAKWFADDP